LNQEKNLKEINPMITVARIELTAKTVWDRNLVPVGLLLKSINNNIPSREN
jgi:hypothetical protein